MSTYTPERIAELRQYITDIPVAELTVIDLAERLGAAHCELLKALSEIERLQEREVQLFKDKLEYGEQLAELCHIISLEESDRKLLPEGSTTAVAGEIIRRNRTQIERLHAELASAKEQGFREAMEAVARAYDAWAEDAELLAKSDSDLDRRMFTHMAQSNRKEAAKFRSLLPKETTNA